MRCRLSTLQLILALQLQQNGKFVISESLRQLVPCLESEFLPGPLVLLVSRSKFVLF
jgi:hypothetical protein